MFTKTGLRPRESRRNGDLSGGLSSIRKLPPIVATTTTTAPPSYGGVSGGGSVKVTARMLRARREGAKARFAATAPATTATPAAAGKSEDRLVSAPASAGGGRGRQKLRLPTLPGKGKAGRVLVRPKRGTSKGKEKKVGGGHRGRQGAVDSGSGAAARPIRKRPEWDDSLRDPSQYRLTPEEAMARKISLVSKHNTFAFGLGSGDSRCGGGYGDGYAGVAGFSATTPKELIRPLSVEAARARSARRVGERARKVADGEQRYHRRSRSEGGGGSALRGGKDAVSPPLPSVGDGGDLTVSGNGEGGHEAGGPTDLTVALYAVRDNGNSQIVEGCDGRPAETAAAAGRAGRARCNNGESGANRSGNKGGGGGGGEGEESGDGVVASGLTGIEVGIEAFSRRVSRLETTRKARLEAEGVGLKEVEGEVRSVNKKTEQGEVEEEGGGGEEGEETQTDWKISRILRGVEVTREEEADRCRLSGASLRDATHPEDVAGREYRQTPVRTAARTADDDYSSADSGRKMHSSEKAWGHDEPSTTQPRRGRGAGSAKLRGHGHGNTEKAVDLVERVQALEEQVMRACLAPPYAPSTDARETSDKRTAVSDFFCDDTGRKGQDASLAARSSADKMRVVIADLLSLTALLLERATVAEGRLAELSDGRGAPDGVEGDSDPYDASAAKDKEFHDEALLVRSREEASILMGDGNLPPEQRDGAGTAAAAAGAAHSNDFSGVSGGGGIGGGGGGGGGGDTCPSPREWTQRGSSFIDPATDYFRAGRSPSRVSPSPPFHEKMAAVSSAAAEDCWGEALDTVGHLVENRRHADCDKVELEVTPMRAVSTASSMRPPSSFRDSPRPVALSAYPMLPPLPAVVTSAATAAADLPPIRKTGPRTSHPLGGQLQLPPPPPCGAGAVSRRWRARDVLAPLHIPRQSLADDMNSCFGPDFDFSAISTFEENDEEEDARSLPVCLAPTPAKKPNHPFQRTPPPMRSPPARRQQHVGQVGVSSDYAPAFTVGDGGGNSNSSARVYGTTPMRSPPARRQQYVGQGGVSGDYAPAFTVGGGGGNSSSSSSARVRGGLEPPAIGQWYTPAMNGARGRG